MVFWTKEREQRVKFIESKTYELLLELGSDNFKKATKIHFLEERGSLCMCSLNNFSMEIWMKISGDINQDEIILWGITHELGHGVHEIYRGNKEHKYGEAWAEAIRYFTEKRYNPNSNWNIANPNDDIILKKCDYNWDRFKEMFKNKVLPI